MTIYLNIGSNQGDRKALIGQAVALLIKAYPGAEVRLSDYVESEPWGYDSPHPFLNLGIAIDVDGDVNAHEALRSALAIQREISDAPHRSSDGAYCDRPIDIDLIAIDRLRVSDEELTLPHPRAHLRAFVMNPLRQLSPATAAWLALPHQI